MTSPLPPPPAVTRSSEALAGGLPFLLDTLRRPAPAEDFVVDWQLGSAEARER